MRPPVPPEELAAFPAICPLCGEWDPFSEIAAERAAPYSGEPFVCTSCAAVSTHTGRGLEVRVATSAEVTAALDDLAVAETGHIIKVLHLIGAL